MTETVGVGVLGRVTVTAPDADRMIGRGQARELLAFLVACRGVPASTSAVIDALWPDEAPATATTIVHGHIRRLRSALGRDMIVSDPDGYRLALADDDVDLWRVDAAVRSGDHRRARQAWSEPVFGAYADRHWARRALMGLEHLGGIAADGVDLVRSRATTPVTRLIGRRRELAAVSTALERSRLVTIVGLGGVGKTRLALEAISSEPESARVDIGASVGPVISRITGDVGLTATGDPSWDLRTVVSVIGGRRLLVLLDGCEHDAAGSAATIQELLASCPRLTILATSRVALGVPGEQIVPLVPFANPGDPHGDAVALLMDRAAALGSATDRLDRKRLAALCATTAGVPLAIELSVTDAVFGNGDRERPSPGLHPADAVRSLVRLTLDELTPGAATAVHRVARLVDGFTPALLDGFRAPDTSAQGIVHELRAAGLLFSDTTDRLRRSRLLDPVRLVLLDRPDDGALQAVTGAVERLFRALRPTLAGPTVLAAFDAAVDELPNAEALLSALVAAGHHRDALRLVGAGADAWSESGAWTRGGTVIESVLATVRPDPLPHDAALDGLDRTAVLVDPLDWAGAIRARSVVRATYASTFADYDRMRTAAAIAAQAPDPLLESHLQVLLAVGSGYGGDAPSAGHHIRRLRHLVEELDSDDGRAILTQIDALARLLAGDAPGAAALLDTAATATLALGAIADTARIHRLRAMAHRTAGDPTEAIRSLQRAEALALEARAHGSLATIRTDLVDLRHRSGDLDRRIVADALETVLGVGNLRAAGLLRIRLGIIDRDVSMIADAALDLLETDRVWASVALAELHDRLPHVTRSARSSPPRSAHCAPSGAVHSAPTRPPTSTASGPARPPTMCGHPSRRIDCGPSSTGSASPRTPPEPARPLLRPVPGNDTPRA